MDQQEREAFEQMTDLETILGAGFLLCAGDEDRRLVEKYRDEE